MKKFILFFCFLIAAALFAQILIGETPTVLKPQVVSIAGKAELKSGDKWVPLTKNSILSVNDTIRTGDKSLAEIKLADNTVITLSENTEVVLQEMTTEKLKKKSMFGKEGQNLNKIKLNMTNGQIMSKLQKNDKTKNSFSLNTPVAVCGVRGTQFVTSHSGENTNVDVIEGEVDVYNHKFPNKSIKVTAGQTTTVVQNKEPDKPKPLTSEEREKFRQMFAPSEKSGSSQPASNQGSSKQSEKKEQKSTGSVKLKVDM